LVAQSPQCEALLSVSTQSAPHATPLLHVMGAPLPPLPAEPPVLLAAPAVPPAIAPEPLNSPLDRLLPQWISPRTASRITKARCAPWPRFRGAPLETRRPLADREANLEAEVKGIAFRLKCLAVAWRPLRAERLIVSRRRRLMLAVGRPSIK
jgi:hypothetical protein